MFRAGRAAACARNPGVSAYRTSRSPWWSKAYGRWVWFERWSEPRFRAGERPGRLDWTPRRLLRPRALPPFRLRRRGHPLRSLDRLQRRDGRGSNGSDRAELPEGAADQAILPARILPDP